MSAKLTQKPNSEDLFGKTVDRCVTDTIVKAGGGLVIGTVLSLVFFKRRSFPVFLGTGFGVGVGYRNCEVALNAKSSS